MKQKKKITAVFSKAPHNSVSIKEGLDLTLASAAFDQETSALFCREGLRLLVKGQNTKALGIKNHSASIEALSLYGIEKIYYDKEDLKKLELKQSDLFEEARPLKKSEIKNLIAEQDWVFNY